MPRMRSSGAGAAVCVAARLLLPICPVSCAESVQISPDKCGHFFSFMLLPFLLFPEAQKRSTKSKKAEQKVASLRPPALPNGVAISPSTPTAGGGLANQRRPGFSLGPWNLANHTMSEQPILAFFPHAWHPMAQGPPPLSSPLFLCCSARPPRQLRHQLGGPADSHSCHSQGGEAPRLREKSGHFHQQPQTLAQRTILILDARTSKIFMFARSGAPAIRHAGCSIPTQTAK
ncbi:hypothetical protein V8C26DRAFT_97920 [Trichoderma gracile]